MFWHARMHQDAGNAWLRQLIAATFAATPAEVAAAEVESSQHDGDTVPGRARDTRVEYDRDRPGDRPGRPRSDAGDDVVAELLDGARAYTRSGAALRIAGRLTGLWPALAALLLVPRPLRDWVYGLVARNRYRWFGHQTECWLPTPELRRRFL